MNGVSLILFSLCPLPHDPKLGSTPAVEPPPCPTTPMKHPALRRIEPVPPSRIGLFVKCMAGPAVYFRDLWAWTSTTNDNWFWDDCHPYHCDPCDLDDDRDVDLADFAELQREMP